jgi:general secretion pathway protein E
MIAPQQIKLARIRSLETGQPFLELLKTETALSHNEFAKELADLWQLPFYSIQDLHAYTPDYSTISYSEAVRNSCLVLRNEANQLHIILDNPFDQDLQDWINCHIEETFQYGLAASTDISAIHHAHESKMRALDNFVEQPLSAQNHHQLIEDLSLAKITSDHSHIVKLVHSTLYDALKSKVSDVHLESDAQGLVIKYRLDGVLTTITRIEGQHIAEQVLSRIKVMSELDIAERRIPQDGRFKVSIQGREVDFRVSVMPNIFGEDAVLRVLDRTTITEQNTSLTLEKLGFDAMTIARIRKMANEPYGMMLVTGPTGSGKTTTLYASISEINHGQDKIITIEDPVEYQLAGVLQIPVNEKKGLTFARGLRSILRHDPDKIMVGEIRDSETAQIAIQSALTGHLVFTTVHANNVFDVISRFTHMNVDPYSFVAALNGIISQRLLRVICTECAVEDDPSNELLELSALQNKDTHDFQFRKGLGCGHCRGSGYRGRRAIAEILDLNDEIRELIINKHPVKYIKEIAKANGTIFLRDVALSLVKDGITTLQEINRVTFAD